MSLRRMLFALVLVVASIRSIHALGLFFRTSWVHEVPAATLQSWFSLIARGRAEGPSSPYYVEYLAIQNIACNQWDPIGPPCNASAPTRSKQALGNSSLPYATVWESDLAVIAPYFHLFDTVYVGTIWVDEWNAADHDSNTRAAELQAKVCDDNKYSNDLICLRSHLSLFSLIYPLRSSILHPQYKL